jgi:peptide/nickel transport system substrate-binding protein
MASRWWTPVTTPPRRRCSLRSPCPAGLQNLDGFNDPAITAALEQARSTGGPDQRAALVAKAEKLTMQQLPWIPDVQPDTVLVLGKGLIGAVSWTDYEYYPWADSLGQAR